MTRNRRAGVEDLWTKTVRDVEGNAQAVPSAHHGIGLRWRARYVDDEGRERTKAFTRRAGGGPVTVAAVYASGSKAQGHFSAKTAATRKSAWGSRVKPRWSDVPVIDVKTSAVRAWVAKMRADEVGTPAEDRRIPCNPCEGVLLPKRKHADRGYQSHEQVAR